MLVTRWQAAVTPSRQQVAMMLAGEELESFEETLQPHQKIPEHRQPFYEIRVVISGELMINVSGNQLLLRPGDRIEIPANTKHSHWAHGEGPCQCLVAQRAF